MGISASQRLLNGHIVTIAAGANEVIPVTGASGVYVYGASGATGTILKCDESGTAALGQSATSVTLAALNNITSCFVKVANTHGSLDLQIHVV
jgi:hypothetical protein